MLSDSEVLYLKYTAYFKKKLPTMRIQSEIYDDIVIPVTQCQQAHSKMRK